jgi:hypothetical protein
VGGSRQIGGAAESGEGAKQVVAALGTADAGNTLGPIAPEAECRGGAGNKRQAELAIEGGVALFVGGLKGWEALAEELSQQVGLAWAVGDRRGASWICAADTEATEKKRQQRERPLAEGRRRHARSRPPSRFRRSGGVSGAEPP